MATVDLTKHLDKTHETKTLAEVLGLPVEALQGVSAKDGEALRAAFGIKTVRDLGTNRFFRLAQALVAMHEAHEAGGGAE